MHLVQEACLTVLATIGAATALSIPLHASLNYTSNITRRGSCPETAFLPASWRNRMVRPAKLPPVPPQPFPYPGSRIPLELKREDDGLCIYNVVGLWAGQVAEAVMPSPASAELDDATVVELEQRKLRMLMLKEYLYDGEANGQPWLITKAVGLSRKDSYDPYGPVEDTRQFKYITGAYDNKGDRIEAHHIAACLDLLEQIFVKVVDRQVKYATYNGVLYEDLDFNHILFKHMADFTKPLNLLNSDVVFVDWSSKRTRVIPKGEVITDEMKRSWRKAIEKKQIQAYGPNGICQVTTDSGM